jgi:hypothetical protein
LRPIHAARWTRRRAASISVATSARTLLHALLLEQRAVLVRPALEAVERPLVRRAGDAECARADHRARDLERRERARRPRRLARPRALEPPLQAIEPAEQVVHRHADVVEDKLGGLRRADPELVLLLAHAEPGRALLHDERRLSAVAELGVDGRDDHVHVGDAAVRDEDLRAVEDPVVAVATRGRAQRSDVRAGADLGDRVGAELDLVADAEALLHPAADLLRRPGRGDPRRRERGPRDASAMPAQPQCSSSA